MDEALGQSLSPEQSEEAEAELEAMEADYAVLEAAEQLPSAPKVWTCGLPFDGDRRMHVAALKWHIR